MPAQDIAMKLFAKNIIKLNEFQKIKEKSLSDLNEYILLYVILQGNNKAYDVLVEALKELNCDFLVTHLESDYIDEDQKP